MRSSYSRSLTPDSESDDATDSRKFNYSEDEEADKRDFNDDEDDDELMKKLETKYGKLDDSKYSYKRESADEEDDEEEEDIDEDQHFESWKRNFHYIYYILYN